MNKSNLKDNVDQVKITLRIDELNEGISLQNLSRILKAMDKNLKISFAALDMSSIQNKENKFAVKASAVKKGSFVFDFLLQVHKSDISQLSLMPLLAIDPVIIWDNFKKAVEFLKKIYELKKLNQLPNIHVSESPGANIFIIQGNNIQISRNIISTAVDISPELKNMMSPIKRGEIKALEFIDHEATDNLILTEGDVAIADIASIVSNEPEEYHAEIISYNKRTKAGRVKIINKNMMNSVYTYKLVSKNLQNNAIDALKNQACKITCLPESFQGSDGTPIIVAIHITLIKNI
jgi:hypothetical protein